MCTGQPSLRTDRLHRSREPETHAQNGEALGRDSRRPRCNRSEAGFDRPADRPQMCPPPPSTNRRDCRDCRTLERRNAVERGPRVKSGTGPPPLPPPGDAAPRKTKAFQRSPQRGERPVARGGRALHRPSLFCRQRARSPRATNQTLALSAKPSVETTQQSKSLSSIEQTRAGQPVP